MLAVASDPFEFLPLAAGTTPSPDPTDDVDVQRRLVEALSRSTRATTLETHISFVLLTGARAYKIKKALDLGFLDFRTLSSRRFHCEEELRLNRRTAAGVYLGVVPITGTIDEPRVRGSGAILEYAVEMREFPQEALATRALSRGDLSPALVDALAARIAAFHRGAAVAHAEGALGEPAAMLRLALQNFTQLRPLLPAHADGEDLDELAAWTRTTYDACAESMSRRRQRGFVRECHGDLHLGNIAILEGQPLIFDCIEFNESMRWIDVMNELAFTTMDFMARGRSDLASRFLDAYLGITGDYEGLGVLRFYLVYRAMVRAKVARLRAAQLAPGDAHDALCLECDRHLRLAKSFTQRVQPGLVIMHGLSGSGKTTVSQALLESVGAVRIRSDVERKRLFSRLPAHAADAAVDQGLYAPAATRETYLRTLALARCVIAAGFVAVVDAAFLKRWQRRWFHELAAELDVPFVIVSLAADEATLRERIVHRLREASDASDADLAVLDHQRQTQEPLLPAERDGAVILEGEDVRAVATATAWGEVLEQHFRVHRDALPGDAPRDSPEPGDRRDASPREA